MPKKYKLLLSVPHASGCEGRQGSGSHPCDPAAAGLAKLIAVQCEQYGVSTRTFLGTTPRAELDMNRPWSRASQWRRDLLSAAVSCSTHIDVHSYPDSYVGFAGFSAVIVCPSRPTYWHAVMAEELAAASVPTAIAVSPGMTDITAQLTEEGLVSWVVEISEGITDVARLSLVADIIAYVVVRASKDAGNKMREPCAFLNPDVPCYIVDANSPEDRSRVWFPSDRQHTEEPRICAFCGRDKADIICSACKAVFYCSAEHQITDWIRRNHALYCPLLAWSHSLAFR